MFETKSIPGKIYENSEMVHFAETNQAPSAYSILQHIYRIATSKLLSRSCLRYLQAALIMRGKGIGLRIYVTYCLKH